MHIFGFCINNSVKHYEWRKSLKSIWTAEKRWQSLYDTRKSSLKISRMHERLTEDGTKYWRIKCKSLCWTNSLFYNSKFIFKNIQLKGESVFTCWEKINENLSIPIAKLLIHLVLSFCWICSLVFTNISRYEWFLHLFLH